MQPLDAGWQFAWEPGARAAEPEWQPLEGPRRYFPIQNAARLRLRIELPPDPCRDPIVFFGLVNQSFVAYLNGTPVYRFGRPEAGPEGFAGWPSHLIPVAVSGATPRLLELRIFSDFSNIGVGGGVPELACRDAKLLDLLREDLPQATIAAIALLAGCFVLTLFRSGGRDPLFLFFALFSITAGLYLISNRTFRLQNLVFDAPMTWMYVSYVTLYIIPIAAGFFFRQVFEFSRLLLLGFRVSVLMTAALLIANVAGWIPWYRGHDPFLMFVGLILVATDVWMLRALLGAGTERRVLAGAVLFFSMCAAFDIAGALGFVPWPVQAIMIGFSIVLLGMAFVTWLRYAETHQAAARYAAELEIAHRALQNYASDLEAEVAARTDSLARSLEEVRQLKEQQDGDYFLVSRLMEPMNAGPGLSAGPVQVSFFLEQRKKFRFRGWVGEVGGDLCLADRVQLKGKDYVLFLNADAMGKSMQGVGGAIVIAVAYRGLVSRVARSSAASPEEWLLNALTEMNLALRPFHGGMLVSLAIGLVDGDGEVLYLNADHPEPVLYRGGRANIQPIRRSGTKLGHGDPAEFEAAGVERLRLASGDRLIFGSDGRDDLAIPADSADAGGHDGQPVLVDSNEGRFVNAVEENRGDLKKIVQDLRSRGEIIDDLSLLCIHYR